MSRRNPSKVACGLCLAWALAPALLQADEPKAQEYAVRTAFNVRVRMSDGVELSADVTRPDVEGRFPVVLSRTPYNKASGGKTTIERWRYFASRGYVVVAMDVR